MADRLTMAEVYETLQRHEGMEIAQELAGLDRSAILMTTNASELREHLQLVGAEIESQRFFRDDAQDHRDELLNETARLLHNFVASVMSLIEHSRRIVGKYLVDPAPAARRFLDTYERSCSHMASNASYRFIQQLRVFVQHRSLPSPIGASIWRNGQDAQHFAGLRTKDLRAWDKWDRSVRDMFDGLDNQKGHVVLEPLVEDYAAQAKLVTAQLRQAVVAATDPTLAKEQNALVDRFEELVGRPTSMPRLR